MEHDSDLERVGAAAARLAGPGEALAAVIAAEPEPGQLVYLCAFDGGPRAWVALDGSGRMVDDRRLVRDAVSIAALCELAAEAAGGGRLDELRARLESVRASGEVGGIEEAEAAAADLERIVDRPPGPASPERLDAIAAATRRLEDALGAGLRSPFAEAMRQAAASVEELQHEVEAGYKGELR